MQVANARLLRLPACRSRVKTEDSARTLGLHFSASAPPTTRGFCVKLSSPHATLSHVTPRPPAWITPTPPSPVSAPLARRATLATRRWLPATAPPVTATRLAWTRPVASSVFAPQHIQVCVCVVCVACVCVGGGGWGGIEPCLFVFFWHAQVLFIMYLFAG